jgi:hypothetical protein
MIRKSLPVTDNDGDIDQGESPSPVNVPISFGLVWLASSGSRAADSTTRSKPHAFNSLRR